MLDAMIRPLWDRLMRPIGNAIGGVGIHPNAITVFGVLVQGVAAWQILEGRVVTAGLIAIGAAIADVLDGAVAKGRGMASRFGAILDSTTDRLADALFFVPIAWLYGVSPSSPERDEPWVAAVALAALVGSFLVSYVKARAEGAGISCNVGIAARAERTIIMIAALVFDLIPPIVSVLAALSVVTFVQRLVHVGRAATLET